MTVQPSFRPTATRPRSEARFRPEHVPAAGPIYRKTEQLQLHHSGSRPGGLQRGFPSNSSLNSLGQPRSEGAAQAQRPAGGEYRCATAFPSAEQVCLVLAGWGQWWESMGGRSN